MQLPAVTAIFRFSWKISGGSTNTKKTGKKWGRKKPVVSRTQAGYNFFALYHTYVRVRDQVFGSTPLLFKYCPVVLEVRWRGQRIHYIACFPRLLCCYSQKNSACWIVHSNQMCGVLLYYIKKGYHRRSRRNVAQMRGAIREDRTSPVNSTSVSYTHLTLPTKA